MEFQQRYGERGLVVLGVSLDDDGWKSVKPFIDSKGLNYRVVLGNEGVTHLYGGLDALPATLLIDGQGKIVSMHSGLVGKDVYEDEIKALLAPPSPR
jgi:cytochrome c biogenesis protein CcmG/thiol:disulfide interchange protein DsbE